MSASALARPSALLVGAGGLGCAAGLALARSGQRLAVTVLDTDLVDLSNLHRQVLYVPTDAGASKAERAAERLGAEARASGTDLEVNAICEVLDPSNARALVRQHDVVIEGTDNHAAKFLAGDAAALEGVASVHAGVVRWAGWAMAVRPRRSACLRCLFEDVPSAPVQTCSEAGVMGPVVGTMGYLEAIMALRLLGPAPSDESEDCAGIIHRFDARLGAARSTRVRRRAGCELCDEGGIVEIDPRRYGPAGCAA